jgi:hypothetical protein
MLWSEVKIQNLKPDIYLIFIPKALIFCLTSVVSKFTKQSLPPVTYSSLRSRIACEGGFNENRETPLCPVVLFFM